MEDPVHEIRAVIKSITEPRDAKEILAGVDKYFAKDAIIVHPMLNSPASSGREGVKAAYKMLRVLTLNQKIQFNAIGFDRIVMRQGQECRTALIDLTENLQLRFIPLPESLSPTFHVRFLTRVDLRKSKDDELWYIEKQEDNLPSDFGSTGIRDFPGLSQFSNAIKWACGVGTVAVGGTLSYFGILD